MMYSEVFPPPTSDRILQAFLMKSIPHSICYLFDCLCDIFIGSALHVTHIVIFVLLTPPAFGFRSYRPQPV